MIKTDGGCVAGAMLALVACASVGCSAPAPPAETETVNEAARPASRATEIADAVLEAMGGQQAWQSTRYVSWRFFGRRLHYWDRETGDIRIESPQSRRGDEVRPEVLVLMNVDTGQGRVWEAGDEITDPDRLAELLDLGRQWWVNDSYWMFMPYKLLDPGVRLDHVGERPLEDGRPADVLDVTFEDGIGYTPQNRYEVFVAKDTGLVEQWSFYAEAAETEPRFTLPWAEWRQFGQIKLATGHGQDADWEIAVHDTLPAAVFSDPSPTTI